MPRVRAVTVDETLPPGHDLPAYIVRPAGAQAGAHPGVLWLHWLGNERSDRTEFLTEAIELAALGVVSVLPEGLFPWRVDPVGTVADRESVDAEVRRVRAALGVLRGLDAVDGERVGIVAHDYGAMLTLAGDGLGAQAVVALTPDTCWDTWFTTYWLGGSSPEAYPACFDGVEPLAGAAACQDRLLLQWAQHDEFVPPAVPAAYAEAAPEAWAVSYRRADHRVGARAARERRDFLGSRLGF